MPGTQITVKPFDLTTATKEDYWTTAPYEFLYSLRTDKFFHQKTLEELTEASRLAGCRNFKKMYAEYVKDIRQSSAKPVGSVTEFDGQRLELQTGRWIADETGVSCEGDFQTVDACSHPIMPVERLINIDSGTEKLKIAFRTGGRWREHLTDRSTLASANAIVALSDYGVSVTSESAKALVRYFQEIEHLNYEIIPEKHSVGRLGWIPEHGFSPYVDNLVFDGDANFRTLFESVGAHGNERQWLDLVAEIRGGSLTARVVLAASFASVLVGPCGCLPFFVHLWGSESGTGKTVALMVAASVWACPAIGKFVQTFNSTSVSRERMASFLNSLPMMLDELQLAKDNRGRQQFDVYQLAEGVGKGRGTKTGGVEKTATWANCSITTGESPITQPGAGAGAINRVIDIECRAAEPVITDGHRVVGNISTNYGFAGKRFVDRLTAEGIEEARALYSNYFLQLTQGDTTEKQAMSAALIITADYLATEWIFQDDRNVTVQEIRQFLSTKAQVSANDRGYQFLCDWTAQNEQRFYRDQNGERFGEMDGNVVYIIRTVFDKALIENGFSPTALLSWLKLNKLIKTEQGRNTIKRRMGGSFPRCVAVNIDPDQENPFDL